MTAHPVRQSAPRPGRGGVRAAGRPASRSRAVSSAGGLPACSRAMESAARSSATSRAVRRSARRRAVSDGWPAVLGVVGTGVTDRPGRRGVVRGTGGGRCRAGWRWSCRLLRDVVGGAGRLPGGLGARGAGAGRCRIPTFPIGLIGILAPKRPPGKTATGSWTSRSRNERRRRSEGCRRTGATVRGADPCAGTPHRTPRQDTSAGPRVRTPRQDTASGIPRPGGVHPGAVRDRGGSFRRQVFRVRPMKSPRAGANSDTGAATRLPSSLNAAVIVCPRCRT